MRFDPDAVDWVHGLVSRPSRKHSPATLLAFARIAAATEAAKCGELVADLGHEDVEPLEIPECMRPGWYR